MKKIYLSLVIIIFSLVSVSQIKPFRFAFISDTHIGSPDGKAEEDLRRTVHDINSINDMLDGPVVSTPVIYKNDVIFGAWDTYLYSLNKNTGAFNWKWSNGSAIRNYSPAACIPVIHDDVIYIVAPDRYLTAIDASTGKSLWRTNESTVRESIGISRDGKFIYGKTMNDTLAVFATNREPQKAAWKLNVGYSYEHTPSMLIEKDGIIFFGTGNGVVYAVNALQRKIEWAYKIDNPMINTVRVIDKGNVIVSTMDGKVVLLQAN